MSSMPAPPTRILLADNHELVRRGLRLILESEDDLSVVAEAGDGAEAVQEAADHEIDLAILDVAMPKLTGLQAAREIRRRAPDLPIIMLSVYDSEQYFFEALRIGASGYVLKSGADRDLVEACRSAVRGEPFFFPAGVAALVRAHLDLERSLHRRATADDLLTPRELEVVKLVAEGSTSREIATALAISAKTVERHRANILEKLGMRDRVQLTRYAIRRGLIEP
jgi:DNA-binding NarL/FixJ family response regulator